MELHELETVLAAEEYRSFTEAAFRLSYSPSTVSKHIRRVEDELGLRIFTRGTKSAAVTLTEDGEKLMDNIRRTVKEYRQMMGKVAELSGGQQLCLGYLPLISGFGEGGYIADFCELRPRVRLSELSLPARELLRALDTGRCDGIFLPVFGYEDGLEVLEKGVLTPAMDCIRCGHFREMHVALSEQLPLAQKEAVSLWDLRDLPLVFRSKGLGSTGDPTRTFRQYFSRRDFDPKMLFESSIGHRVWQMTADGLCGIPSSRVGMGYLGVSYVRVSDWDNPVNVYFLSLRANDSAPLLAFRKFLKAHPDNPDNKKEA